MNRFTFLGDEIALVAFLVLTDVVVVRHLFGVGFVNFGNRGFFVCLVLFNIFFSRGTEGFGSDRFRSCRCSLGGFLNFLFIANEVGIDGSFEFSIGVGRFNRDGGVVVLAGLAGLIEDEQVRSEDTMAVTTGWVGFDERLEDGVPITCVGMTTGKFKSLVELGVVCQVAFA